MHPEKFSNQMIISQLKEKPNSFITLHVERIKHKIQHLCRHTSPLHSYHHRTQSHWLGNWLLDRWLRMLACQKHAANMSMIHEEPGTLAKPLLLCDIILEKVQSEPWMPEFWAASMTALRIARFDLPPLLAVRLEIYGWKLGLVFREGFLTYVTILRISIKRGDYSCPMRVILAEFQLHNLSQSFILQRYDWDEYIILQELWRVEQEVILKAFALNTL